MLDLFNKIWSEGHIPRKFKHAIVCPISKPNKDKKDPASYRPIALTSHLGKILETMINNRLSYTIEKENIINENQSGFRNNRSTMDLLAKLENDITLAKSKKQTLGATFLDLEKAYDTMWRGGLLMELNKHNITGNLYNYILNFLQDSTFQTKL